MKLVHVFLATLIPLGIASVLDEQRCYIDRGELAPKEIIPCYVDNDPKQKYSCCKRGNKCMQDGSCWDRDTGVTYQYGCTDAAYKDPKCPQKCGLSREKSNWVGLVYCGSNNWMCHHPDNCGSNCADRLPWDPLIEKLPDVTCADVREADRKYLAIAAGSRLQDVMELPSGDKEVASYLSYSGRRPEPSTLEVTTRITTTIIGTPSSSRSLPGFQMPTTTMNPSSTAATVTVSLESISSISDSPTSTSQPPLSESSPEIKEGNNHQNLAIGVGVGVSAGLALLGALLFFLYRRRHHNHPKPDLDGISGKREGASPLDQEYSNYTGKSELPSQEMPHELPSPTTATELEGSIVSGRSPLRSPATYQSSLSPRSPMLPMSPMSPIEPQYSDGTELYSNRRPVMTGGLGSPTGAGDVYAHEARSPGGDTIATGHSRFSELPAGTGHHSPGRPGNNVYELPG